MTKLLPQKRTNPIRESRRMGHARATYLAIESMESKQETAVPAPVLRLV
jgi:hypothetical protein